MCDSVPSTRYSSVCNVLRLCRRNTLQTESIISSVSVSIERRKLRLTYVRQFYQILAICYNCSCTRHQRTHRSGRHVHAQVHPTYVFSWPSSKFSMTNTACPIQDIPGPYTYYNSYIMFCHYTHASSIY